MSLEKQIEKLKSDNARLRGLLDLIVATPTEINQLRAENAKLKKEKRDVH